MKTIYIDSDFKCHLSAGAGLQAVETDFFDNKCDSYIEGYRYIPEGENWTRDDGVVFKGTMITPWTDYRILTTSQKQYTSMFAEMADMRRALDILEVSAE